ncbi:MAG: PHP domain-containing protein [Dehalococcoidia bacterium]
MATGDFHLHSAASDGVRSPTWVVETAAARGVRHLALTDHDTTAGLDEAKRAGERLGLGFVPGIEISVVHQGRDVHLLGFGIDVGSVALQDFLSWQRDGRVRRMEATVELLAKHGVTIDFERVRAIAGGASIGRPHLARAMMEAGYVGSVQEAFDVWLAEGQPGYVGRERLAPREAIDLIHRAGGVAFAAHPVFLGDDYPERIRELAPMGLDGLETYYKHYEPETVAAHEELATSLGLAMSGGSDYHGLGNPNDREIGDIPFPDEAVEAFLAFLARRGVHMTQAGGTPC